jgi:hypothetical protein
MRTLFVDEEEEEEVLVEERWLGSMERQTERERKRERERERKKEMASYVKHAKTYINT